MIDDDEDDYILTRHMLFEARRESYCLDWAGTYDEGWEKLKTDRYDAILMDYDLGPHNGLELTRKAMAAGCRAPIILYTGRGSYEVDLEAMEAGATLYLTKGETSALMLERSIRYAMDHKKAEQDLANANALLEKQKQELDRRLKERSELLKSITDERMQAEERQARIQTILDTLPVGIAILDNQGNLVESNDQAAVSWGVRIRTAGRQGLWWWESTSASRRRWRPS
jgi:DNA-binding response OmpR family regulator